MNIPPIQVWQFKDAPQEFKNLSSHGGDEDWLAFVPFYYGDEPPIWMMSGAPFGCCDVSKTPALNGWVYIGAHA